MEERSWLDRKSHGILRVIVLVAVCFVSAWIGASVPNREARASVPDYLKEVSGEVREISDEMKKISSEMKASNRYLKEMEDSLDRIQKEYTK